MSNQLERELEHTRHVLANLLWEEPWLDNQGECPGKCGWCSGDEEGGHSDTCPWLEAHLLLTESE